MNYSNETLKELILSALREDIGAGDHSTLSCIDPQARGKAVLKIKENGILAGMEVARTIFEMQDVSARFEAFKKDGDPMTAGELAFEVEAHIHTLLSCERLVLNCMQRMSGIATLTSQYTTLLEGKHTRLLDTRKTTPNFRLLEKEAVRIGGGTNHRFGLYDMIMLKDNHIDFCGGIIPAVEKAWNYVQDRNLGIRIEVETRTPEDVQAALSTGKVDVIMLDNFTPEQVQQAVKLINGRCETEASGGINLQNLVDYAATGVDYVSSGAIIHQARSLDLSLKALIP